MHASLPSSWGIDVHSYINEQQKFGRGKPMHILDEIRPESNAGVDRWCRPFLFSSMMQTSFRTFCMILILVNLCYMLQRCMCLLYLDLVTLLTKKKIYFSSSIKL